MKRAAIRLAKDQPKPVSGGVVAPKGFRCHALEVGIKDPAKPRLDLALIYSVAPAHCAATFTSNKVKAAPVRVSAEHIRRGRVQAIVANSGNANACTGPRGIQDAKAMCAAAARTLDLRPSQVAVCSTGIIGLPLPIDRMLPHFPALAGGLQGRDGDRVAKAIMTSDTHPKSLAVEVMLGKTPVRFGATAKGAGMICPSMGTMFCFVTTDAAVSPDELKKATLCAVEQSFNRVSIDGDTSTNDTVLCLANGLAGNSTITSGSQSYRQFVSMLTEVSQHLALSICRDGEGVTKVVKVAVTGASSTAMARRVAQTIATSNLVKTALFGEDANWGRVMGAIGRSGVPINPDTVTVRFDKVVMVKRGMGTGLAAERKIAQVFKQKEFTISVDLGQGQSAAHMWTTDLSYDYVRINASYRS